MFDFGDKAKVAASDEELVSLVVAAGDRESFGELVRRHQSLVRSMMQRMCRNTALADDLAQEAFIRAFTKIDTFKGQGSFKSWLCRIAYTEFLQSARKRKAADAALDRLTAEPIETSQAPVDAGARHDLDRALATLKEEERVCVVLCYANGMSHSEAAEVTGLPLGTVKSHVNRGRDKLKTWFETQEKVA